MFLNREAANPVDPLRFRHSVDEALNIRPLPPLMQNEDLKERHSLETLDASSLSSATEEVEYIREAAVSVDDQTQEDACLAKILEVLPDVCRDHARKLYQERRTQDFKYSSIRADRRNYDPSELLIQSLLEGSYPKHKDTKRKRSLSSTGSQAEKQKWEVGDGHRDKLYLEAA